MCSRNVVIGGGTGNIGKYLTRKLISDGHNVSLISRKNANMMNWVSSTMNSKKCPEIIEWKSIEKEGLPLDTDIVINLAGKSIGKIGPWLPSLKDSIMNSRLNSTKTLAKAIAKSHSPPKVFISASAVGIYECNPAMTYSESDAPVREGKENFFTSLCQKWEDSAYLPKKDGDGIAGSVYTHVYKESHTRIVNPRFGVVLAHNTPPMNLLLMSCFAGGSAVLGSGTQPFPWIHIDDTIEVLLTMIKSEELYGPVNVVAPQIVSNSGFSKALEDACYTERMLPGLPAAIVRLMYGKERADSILLDSPKVIPQKLLDLGFEFKYPDIDSAMRALVEAECTAKPVLRKVLEAKKARSRGNS